MIKFMNQGHDAEVWVNPDQVRGVTNAVKDDRNGEQCSYIYTGDKIFHVIGKPETVAHQIAAWRAANR